MLRFTRRIVPLLNNVRRLQIFKYINCSKLILGAGCAAVSLTNTGGDRMKLNFEEEIKRATEEGEKYLAQLMRVLRTLILQTSIEYQECLIAQIELTKISTRVGPVGTHWDELTSFRVKGGELKDELNRYEVLATSIADIVNQQTSSSVDSVSEIVLKQLSTELTKLEKLRNEQLEEIHKYETELLIANRDSILHGLHSQFKIK